MNKCEMCGQTVKRKEFYACTGWTTEDILVQAKEDGMSMTKKQALEFLEVYSDKIIEAMVQEGWSVIQHFLAEKRREGKPSLYDQTILELLESKRKAREIANAESAERGDQK